MRVKVHKLDTIINGIWYWATTESGVLVGEGDTREECLNDAVIGIAQLTGSPCQRADLRDDDSGETI